MKRAARHKTGSVVFDKRRKTWNFLWWEGTRRRSLLIGSRLQYPTKGSARKAAEDMTRALPSQTPMHLAAPTVAALVQQYRSSKRMPDRYSTRRAYNSWFDNHVLPVWGNHSITSLEAQPVELWLDTLTSLSPRSRGAIRALIGAIWNYAMWTQAIPTQRNPMELVTIKGSSKRTTKPRSLPVEEFQRFVDNLENPFRLMALVNVCFGLRISECLGLKWSDVDWVAGKLHVQRAIVRQHLDETKSEYSNRPLPIDSRMLQALRLWRQTTEFSAQEDWVFASPAQYGRLPWSADAVNDRFLRAEKAAGIAHVSTHCMRHTYRSWLDAVGTAIAVQQKMMRHADIRTTMNTYGDVITDEMSVASSKVADLALSGSQVDRKQS
jgi:integrase